MPFHDFELKYLTEQPLGRLATVTPDGDPQVAPVGFRYNATIVSIDIGGYGMASSRKFRNVAATGTASLVVDDTPSISPWRVRCLEIRGDAEAIDPAVSGSDSSDGAIIRIHPRRNISFGIDQPDVGPHELVAHNRDVAGPHRRRSDTGSRRL